MNASRIPGWYAYPVLEYSHSPVEAVQAVRGRPEGRLISAFSSALEAPIDSSEALREWRGRQQQDNIYQDRAFSGRGAPQKGLLLNLLG